MKTNCLILIIFFIPLICLLKGQQSTKKIQSKFNRFFSNISRDCLKENRVTPERIAAVYTFNTNDKEAKCYVACMLLHFNVTTENGEYNDKALEKLLVRPNNINDVPNGMKNAIKQCEKEDDKDRCEKAVKFTKCIYAHKNEISTANVTTAGNRRRPPMMPFGRRPRP